MPSTDIVRIGRFKMSKQKFWKRVYFFISVGIAFLFVSSLVYMILFGKNPGG